MQEPTLQEIAKEAGLTKEEIVYALDAIQSPVSLYDPVYTDGGDTLYVMDQISDKKNKEDNWVEGLALSDAMNQMCIRDSDIMVVCLSGRGDKDVNTIADYLAGKGYLN